MIPTYHMDAVCASGVVRWGPAIFPEMKTLDIYKPNAFVSASTDLLWEHTHRKICTLKHMHTYVKAFPISTQVFLAARKC